MQKNRRPPTDAPHPCATLIIIAPTKHPKQRLLDIDNARVNGANVKPTMGDSNRTDNGGQAGGMGVPDVLNDKKIFKYHISNSGTTQI